MNTSSKARPKLLNIALWISQSVLAIMFFIIGSTKLFQPVEQLIASMPSLENMPILLTRFIGLSEFAASVGLLLPSIIRIMPRLTGHAALGLLVVMLLAAGLHGARGEFSVIVANLVIASMAAFVAWGRLKKVPIASKV